MATTLSAGDIAFVGFKSNNPDSFAFATFVTITAGTVIYFTDNAWTGTALATTEGYLSWTATTDHAAGSVVTLTAASGALTEANWATVSGSFAMNASGDNLFAFQAAAFTTAPTTPTLLAGIVSRSFITTGTTSASTTYLPSALALGATALDMTGSATTTSDGYYNGALTTGTAAQLRAAIDNRANWFTSNGTTAIPAFAGFTVQTPGFTVSPGTIAATEGGATATFTVVLNAQPTGTVTVSVSGDSQATANLGTLTFTAANWNIAQTVTVTATDDAIAEGTHTGLVTLAPATSTDAAYNGLNPADVTVTITDNDAAGFIVSPATVAVTEGGSTATFTVALATQPTGTVTIPVSGDGQVNASTGTLTFTAANWNVAQTVTVTAIDDTAVEGTHAGLIALGAASSTDAAYNGLNPADVAATITDNDVAATVSVGSASVAEGNSGTSALVFTITRSDNTGAFSLTYATADGTATAGSDYAGASGTVSFAAGGALSQTVTISVNGDTTVEPNETLTLTLSNLVNTTGTATLGTASATGTIVNDDTATASVWFNEFHYDNIGTDTGEFIEIAGAAGTDLTGWQILRYNGNVPAAAVVYTTPGSISLAGSIIPDQGNGYGTVGFALPQDGLQNGSNDGFALVDASGAVVQLLSYEGVLTASGGAASGLTSTDVGVAESNTTPVGASLGLTGTGTSYASFTWSVLAAATIGGINAGQSFGGSANPSIAINDVSVTEGDSGTKTLTFTVTRSAAATAFTVDYATADGTATAGSDYQAASGTLAFAAGGPLTQTVAVTINGDTASEANETFTVQLSNLVNVSGTTTIGDSSGTGTITNDDVSFVRIYDVQGSGHKSAYVGGAVGTAGTSGTTRVNVQGVVTAIGDNGFYIQDATGDGNAATSDGIFVFTGASGTNFTASQALAVGSTVNVLGAQVSEFLPGSGGLTVTELVASASIAGSSIVSLGGTTAIAPVVLGVDRSVPTGAIASAGFSVFDPGTYAADFWETLEGMLVQVPNPVSISPTKDFRTRDPANSANAEGPPNQEIWVRTGTAYDASSSTPRGGLIISATDANPERILLDDLRASLDMPEVNVGATLATATGVVGYDFGSYRVNVSTAPAVVSTGTLAPETTAITRNSRQVTIGDYNCENLDPVAESTAAGSVEGSDLYTRLGNSDDDIGDGHYALHAQHIAVSLGAPTIVCLQEIQDSDGATISNVLDSDVTLGTLTNLISSTYGIAYQFAYIAPTASNINGGQPNANIRQAFLYRADQVSLKSLTQLTDPSPNEADLYAGDDLASSRKPLVGTFTYNGVDFTVINNHLNSKGGDDSLFGSSQPTVESSQNQRTEQAKIVNNYIDTLLATDPFAKIVVSGDLNDFTWSAPIQTLQGLPGTQVLFDLAEQLLPVNERYSYVFDGNTQELDHQLVSADLLANAAPVYDVVHVNAEFAAQSSDHDPSVQRLDFTAYSETLTAAAGGETLDGGAGNDTIAGQGGNDTLSGGSGNDTIAGGDGNDAIDGGTGTDTAVFTAARASSRLQWTDATITVTALAGSGGTDTLTNIEAMTFAGVAVSVTPATLSVATKDTATFSAAGGIVSAANPTVTVSGTTTAADALAPFVAGVFQGAVIDNAGTIASTGTGARAVRITGTDTGNRNVAIFNRAGGLITSQNDAVQVQPAITGGSLIVDNAGTIASTGTGANNGQAVDFGNIVGTGATITVINRAGGLMSAADADGIRPGRNATVDNAGTIIGRNGSAGATGNDGVDFQDYGGTLINRAGGQVTGPRHGVSGKAPVTVTNDGTITGLLGAGINLDTIGNTTTVTNAGTITGTAAGTTDGDGIDIDALVAITNSGSILALGTWSGGLSEAITVGGGTIANQAGGVIRSSQRAITVDDSNLGNAFAATVIVNAGLIDGQNGEAIDITDTFADTITNTGTINGSIATSGGDDVFNLYAGSAINGTVDAGTGTDTVNLLGSGAGSLGALSNVEAVVVTSGSWTLTTEAFGTVALAAPNLTLTLGGSVLADNSFAAVIAGFAAGDALDLAAIGTATGASLGAGNVLTVTRATGAAVTLRLDPAASYAGQVFRVASDNAGGAIVTTGTNSAPVLAATAALSVAENLTAIGTVQATDAEADAVAYAIAGGADAAAFAIDAATGALGFATARDYETPESAAGTSTYQVTVSATDAFGAASIQAVTVTVTDTAESGQALTGTAASEVLAGTSGDDTIAGLGGDDTLNGLDGNDSLAGGGGDDALSGGRGTDTAVFSGPAGDYRVRYAGAALQVADTAAGRDGTDTLSGIERAAFNGAAYAIAAPGTTAGDGGANLIAGSAANEALTGGAGNDALFGNGGTDTLDGGTGADVMVGGQSAADVTTYVVDNAGDTVVAGAGLDTVQTSLATYVLTAGAENLLYIGAGPSFIGTGNALANVITGAAGIVTSTLYGNAGNDTLTGGAAADALYGGADNDTLSGGAGKDQLFGEAGSDTLDGGAGSDILSGGAGADRFLFTKGQASGDSVTDFQNGVDLLDFYGFAANSTFTKTSATATYSIWTVKDGGVGAGESILFTGVPSATVITGYAFH